VILILAVIASYPVLSQNTAAFVSKPITAYTLPPDKLAKAHALYLIDVWLYFAATVYSFVILWLILRWRWVVRFSNLAERTSKSRFVQALIVTPLLIAVVSILLLPPELYGHHIGRKYGLSVQGWASWMRDWGVQLVLFAVVGSIVAWILYAVIRRSPQRAWLYFWLAIIPIAGFLTFIAPIVIDPLFNRFTPLETTHPQIVRDLQRVAERGGLDIPADRMYEMNASAKVTGSNAYVTGFGASKRVVVWDTAIQHMSAPDLMFTFGHEMGHYVLGHIAKGFIFAMAFCFVLFYVTWKLAHWSLRKWGARLGIRGLDDWASLPLLALIVSVLLFLSSPGLNAYSRHLEHDADIYGLEVIHGLVPDSSQVAARSFQNLGEEWLEYPYVSRFAEFWLWNHPTNSERVRFAATYDPWQQGRPPKFVK
jgi:Zn-dependent protease with chaperone function